MTHDGIWRICSNPTQILVGCQERRKTCVRTWMRPEATELSPSTAGAVAVPNIQRELTLSFGTRPPWGGGGCIRQYNSLTRELAVQCFSWSRKLGNSKHGQHLDGCPLHVAQWMFSYDKQGVLTTYYNPASWKWKFWKRECVGSVLTMRSHI
jgi:hypothetical protein